jgi:hypothetical protein
VLDPGPEQPEPRIRVEVHHHDHRRRHGPTPQRIVVVVAMVVLGLILLRSPFGLLMLAVLIPPIMWIIFAVMLAVVAIVALREHLAGRKF